MGNADTITQGRQDKMTETGGFEQVRQKNVFCGAKDLIRKWIEIHETAVGHWCNDLSIIKSLRLASTQINVTVQVS